MLSFPPREGEQGMAVGLSIEDLPFTAFFLLQRRILNEGEEGKKVKAQEQKRIKGKEKKYSQTN